MSKGLGIAVHACRNVPRSGNSLYLNSNHRVCDHCGADLEKERMKNALERIIALTHSWVISRETAPCKATFDLIREVARSAD